MNERPPLLESWKSLRYLAASAGDTEIASWKPSLLPTDERVIHVNPESALLLRLWGQPTSNDTATLRISGWMNRAKGSRKHGVGPGFLLWDGQLTLGAQSTTDEAPLESWAAGAWLEVDTAVAGENNCNAVSIGTADSAHILVLPTLGYPKILTEISDMAADAAGAVASHIGIAYREIDAALAYKMIQAVQLDVANGYLSGL